MKSIIIFVFCLLSVCCAQNFLRFTNAFQDTVSISSTATGNVTLAFGQTSSYISVASGSVSVTQVLDNNGTNLISTSILVTFSGYGTVAVAVVNGGFFLLYYNETSSIAAMTTGSTTDAFVRIIDLAPNTTGVAVNANGAPVIQYVTYLENTPFVSVPINNTILSVTVGGSTITLGSINVSNVYTVFVFGNNGTNTASLSLDRSIALAMTTSPIPITTGMMNMTTGMMNMTTGMMNVTSGMMNMTTGMKMNVTTGMMMNMTTGMMMNMTTGMMNMNMTTGPIMTSGMRMTTGKIGATTGSAASSASTLAIGIISSFFAFVLSL
jgi:hypothetical protein